MFASAAEEENLRYHRTRYLLILGPMLRHSAIKFDLNVNRGWRWWWRSTEAHIYSALALKSFDFIARVQRYRVVEDLARRAITQPATPAAARLNLLSTFL